MEIEKGDLVLVSDSESTKTCIILTVKHRSPRSQNFYYTFCIETGLYGITYDKQIMSLVSKNFAPDFEFDSSIFDTNYSYYSELYEIYSYYPNFYPYQSMFEDFFDDLEIAIASQVTASVSKN